ncbi:uroporphyrinogen decarboxylase family protein [Dehalobacter sp.]|uniref:uroporphyrinogen decarboxylase family protein n=1 Tax=Dehalobacter sp. TaxID=1962289 RepID=UPI0002D5256B|nr:uroporphyrinogen decarboxylase family protein [Dehalobacter sp.]
MADSLKSKNAPEEKLQVSRRGFLKTGAAAAAIGVLGAIKAPSKVAEAAVSNYEYITPKKGQWSKLKPEPNYGGASVSYAEHNDQWLGTSKIVGTVKKFKEKDMGFALVAQGLLGPKAQAGFYTIGIRHPLSDALGWAISPIFGENIVDGQPKPEKLPIPDPEQMSMHIKDVAYYLRADEVGIGKMPEYGYYSDKMNPPMMGIIGGMVPRGTPLHKGAFMDMRRRPEELLEAAQALTPLVIRFGMGQMFSTPPKANPKIILLPLHLPTMLKTADFDKFYWPMFKTIIEAFVANGVIPMPFYEGDWSRYYDHLQDLPAKKTLGWFEHGDPKELKQKLGNTMCILGLFPLTLLQYGTKEECITKAKELLDDLAPGGGYIFSTDKELLSAADGKAENIIAVNKFVMEYGIYK